MVNTEKISEAIAELSNSVYEAIIPQTSANDIDAIRQLEAGFEAIELKRVLGSFRTMFSVGIMLAAFEVDDDRSQKLVCYCLWNRTKGSNRNDCI